jgi:hypothetical protein
LFKWLLDSQQRKVEIVAGFHHSQACATVAFAGADKLIIQTTRSSIPDISGFTVFSRASPIVKICSIRESSLDETNSIAYKYTAMTRRILGYK